MSWLSSNGCFPLLLNVCDFQSFLKTFRFALFCGDSDKKNYYSVSPFLEGRKHRYFRETMILDLYFCPMLEVSMD